MSNQDIPEASSSCEDTSTMFDSASGEIYIPYSMAVVLCGSVVSSGEIQAQGERYHRLFKLSDIIRVIQHRKEVKIEVAPGIEKDTLRIASESGQVVGRPYTYPPEMSRATRSIKLSDELWEELQKLAEYRGMGESRALLVEVGMRWFIDSRLW